MGRRRRLALRQLDEDPSTPVDLDDAAEPQEPSFQLLPSLGGDPSAPAAAVAVAAPAGLDKTADADAAPTTKTSSNAADNAPAEGGASSVFRLYQEGIEKDQMLQLCFMRRKPWAHVDHRSMDKAQVAENFIVPLPSMKMRAMFSPLPVDATTLTQASSNGKRNGIARGSLPFQSSNPKHEAEWKHLVSSLRAEDSTTVEQAVVQVDELLHRDSHDQIAQFLWKQGMVELLNAACKMVESGTHIGIVQRRFQPVLHSITRNPSLQALAPQDFRTELRALELHHRVSRPDLAAWANLELLAGFHAQ